MTNERQAEFRGKLFSMLGDRGQAQASASSSSSKDKEASSRRKEGSDREHSNESDGLRVSTANARTNSTESGTGSEGSSGVGRDRVQSPLGPGGQHIERGVEGDGWICPSCTLTNSTLSRRCTTCEAARSN
jgi:Zn-finger in Ran binding protein and others